MENNNIFNFEKLEVWQKAMDLTVEIYKITNDFPKSEQFSLTDQLRRAIVTANIAEGTGRLSHKDQAHFTTIAFASLMETMNHLLLAEKLAYIPVSTVDNLRIKIKNIAAMLSSLHCYQSNH